jgi:hypothetical protein
VTTSGVIYHVLVILSCRSLQYLANMPAFALLFLGFEVIPNDSYHVAWQGLDLMTKYEYLGSLDPVITCICYGSIHP